MHYAISSINAVLVNLLATAAFNHHANLTCMIATLPKVQHECSLGELLVKAAFLHHGNEGHDALKHYVVRKGLT